MCAKPLLTHVTLTGRQEPFDRGRHSRTEKLGNLRKITTHRKGKTLDLITEQ